MTIGDLIDQLINMFDSDGPIDEDEFKDVVAQIHQVLPFHLTLTDLIEWRTMKGKHHTAIHPNNLNKEAHNA